MKSYYKPGDYNVLCDRCGFKKKRSECRFTWDNLLVCSDTCWEPRHPQDFVRGRVDRQRVPHPRPDSQTFMGSTTLASGASANATSITVSSASGMAKYDGIGIALDASGEIHYTYISNLSGTTVTLGTALPSAAASGNTVYTVAGTHYITTSQVLATSL